MAVPGSWLANTMNFDFPLFKFMNILPRHLVPVMLSMLYTDEKFRPEFQGDFATSFDISFVYGMGVEGIREASHWPDNA